MKREVGGKCGHDTRTPRRRRDTRVLPPSYVNNYN